MTFIANRLKLSLMKLVMNIFSSMIKRLTWDLCKIKIKEFSIKFAVNMTRQENDYIKILEKDIITCEHKLSFPLNAACDKN